MTRRKLAIITISYSLALLYAVSFFYYLDQSAVLNILHYSRLVALMFFILFIGASALALGKRWGRDVLVYGNVVFFAVGMWVLILFPDLVQFRQFSEAAFFRSILLGGMFLAVVIAAFFTQSQIRLIINPEWKYSRKSILVIDDDEGIQMTLKRILLNRGYSVLSALSGEKGIQVAINQHPDLVLLDVILPGMKGRSVCAELKKEDRTKDIPVIFLTAKDSEDDIKAEMEVGGVGHMTKPIKTKVLLNEIKRVLG
ncbi:MAG: response regulator [Candidatus Omnitrophota bacterium]